MILEGALQSETAEPSLKNSGEKTISRSLKISFCFSVNPIGTVDLITTIEFDLLLDIVSKTSSSDDVSKKPFCSSKFVGTQTKINWVFFKASLIDVVAKI